MLNEVRAIVTTIPPSQMSDWLVWSEGWDAWKEVHEVDAVLDPIGRTVKGPVPELHLMRNETMTDSMILPKENNTTVERKFAEITASDAAMGSDLDVEVFESKSSNTGFFGRFIKRNFTRYKKHLKIQITGNADQTFSSFSKDISVGGILLSEPLPRWVVGYVQVKIIDKVRKQAIEVTCSVVEDQDPNCRVRLEILPLQKKEEEIHFDKWLAA